MRKQADDKANIARCSETCKMKKMQQESENNKLRRELNLMEETKQNLEKQNRMYEHEVSVTTGARSAENRSRNFFVASKVRERAAKPRPEPEDRNDEVGDGKSPREEFDVGKESLG